jgi:Arc/MetJ-type ribon-helix-helix transcriptional regulator
MIKRKNTKLVSFYLPDELEDLIQERIRNKEFESRTDFFIKTAKDVLTKSDK